jgi:hypothetical protein
MEILLVCVFSNIIFLVLGFAFGKNITTFRISEHDKLEIVPKELHKDVKKEVKNKPKYEDYFFEDEPAEVPEEK